MKFSGLFFSILIYFMMIKVVLADAPFTLALWPQHEQQNISESNPEIASLTVYLPSKNITTGTAVVVCPGGGYGHLAISHEGHDFAKYFNSIGVAAVVVKYRYGASHRHPVPMNDAKRAVRMVRARSEDWGINPEKIGIIGFSAGGHLASTVGTHHDPGIANAVDPVSRFSSRPDFMILVYPVVSLVEDFTHKGSRNNLLGEKPDLSLVKELSNELQVTADTPPTFLIHGHNDTGVSSLNSIAFYSACLKAGVPAELHVYQDGRHGFGLAVGHPVLHNWVERAKEWMHQNGF